MLDSTPRRAALGAALALAAALILTVADAAPSPGDAMVTIKDFDFHPMEVIIPVGASVTWKNLDGEPHTVTSLDGLFRSGALDEDDSFTFKFTKAGVYKYLCSIHPRMMASVTVKAR
jgi:plastocyanin